jgi:hypothetical protein
LSGTGIFPGERDRTVGYNARVSGQTGAILKRLACVSKHAARYRKAASAHAAALKVAAQTNDELAALESLQECVPREVSLPLMKISRMIFQVIERGAWLPPSVRMSSSVQDP